jgi:hypothetical protein
MNRTMRYLVGVALLMVMSCGTTVTVPLDEGWSLWENGLYAEAHAKFVEAGGSEGLNGLGWTTLKMDSLKESEVYFAIAAVGGADTLIDAMAGLTLAAWQQGDHGISLQAASYVLRTEPEYAFIHDAAVTKHTILLAKAYDEYHLLQYANCIASIRLLDDTFNADINDPILAQILLNKLDQLSGTGS